MITKPDIQSPADIEQMVHSFYAKVNEDEKLSAIFNDFAKVNWDTHLPKMVRFWNTLIFGAMSYKGSPFDVHIPLPIDKSHFDRWLELFDQNLDEQFEGPKTEEIKTRAKAIGWTFQSKHEYLSGK